MSTSQIPVIAWERRYMTMRECSRLQSIGGLHLPATQSAAFKALGNAVNVDVVKAIATHLLRSGLARPSRSKGNGEYKHRPARKELARAA
jgi:DNA (cytosine-5)-methyltransferase 1